MNNVSNNKHVFQRTIVLIELSFITSLIFSLIRLVLIDNKIIHESSLITVMRDLIIIGVALSIITNLIAIIKWLTSTNNVSKNMFSKFWIVTIILVFLSVGFYLYHSKIFNEKLKGNCFEYFGGEYTYTCDK